MYSSLPGEPRKTSLLLEAQMHPFVTAAVLAGIGAAHRGSVRRAADGRSAVRAAAQAPPVPRYQPHHAPHAATATTSASSGPGHVSQRERPRGPSAAAALSDAGRAGSPDPALVFRQRQDGRSGCVSSLARMRASLRRMNAIRSPRRHPCSSRRRRRDRPGQGHARSEAAAAAGQPGRSDDLPAKELFGRRDTPADAADRAPSAAMPAAASRARRRSRSTARHWQVMRLSRNRNWGHPQTDRLPAAVRRAASRDQRLARPSRRRHLAAARRADDHGPCLAPDRPRCGYLADADAGPPPVARRARGDVGHQHGARATGSTSIPTRWTPQHTALIRAAATERERRAHLRQPGDQEGAVPGGRRGPRLADEGQADLRPQLPFPHPPRLPGRRGGLLRPGSAAGRRRLRRGAGRTGSRRRCSIPKPGKPRPPLTMAQLPAECRAGPRSAVALKRRRRARDAGRSL